MDMQLMRDRVREKIAALEATIGERDQQVTVLQQQNTADRENIQQLRDTETLVASALDAVAKLDPAILEAPSPTGDPQKRKRVSNLKGVLLDMLGTAGAVGLTAEEIVAHGRSRKSLDLKVGSVKAVLWKLKQNNKVEQRDTNTWRLPLNRLTGNSTAHHASV